MKIAYADCVSGASGDMLLGALVDAGWPAAELEALPARLGLDGVRVKIGRARRGALEGARIDVEVGAAQPMRHLRQVEERLAAASLPERTRERALATFRRLADAEARAHATTADQVHFHEVGAADALVDVTGVCLGVERLGIEAIYCSPLPLGRGTVRAAHGVVPVPAPATAELLRGVPVEMPDIHAELVTPTGAALLVTLVNRWGHCPPFTITAQGTGTGGRDLAEQPNVLRLFVGETADVPAPESGVGRRQVFVLETAIDDAPPQHLAPLLPRLLAAGARDAFLTPILMKKGRPALLLTCLADPGSEGALARMIFVETPTLGIRMRREDRVELERRTVEVETAHGVVAAKVARLPDGSERLMPEYESLAAVAERSGVALLELSRLVVAAWNGRAS